MTENEYQALKESIKTHGIITPIIIGQHIPLIDGRHRILAAQETGQHHIPAHILTNTTKEQEQELKTTLNTNRRHLTTRQKRQITETQLNNNPTRTNKQINAITTTPTTTIKTIRTKLHQDKNTPQP